MDVCNEIDRICNAVRTDKRTEKLCKDTTYDFLNKSFGWYRPFETLAKVREWCNEDENKDSSLAKAMTSDKALERPASTYFEFICNQRKEARDAKREYSRNKSKKMEIQYRSQIRTMTQPLDKYLSAPGSIAQAKWLVKFDAEYVFEFIPGSYTTVARYFDFDLTKAENDPILQTPQMAECIKATPKVEGYAEIAKIAVAIEGDLLGYVPGSVRPGTRGAMDPDRIPFAPCDGFEEIAKLAVMNDAFALRVVPGSVLPSGNRFDPPVPYYNELAKLAASGEWGRWGLEFVPGSVDRNERQLYPTINGYKDIAEVYIRRRPRTLEFVPLDLPGFADLAKIAIGRANNFDKISERISKHPALTAERKAELEAELATFRDRVVEIKQNPEKFEAVLDNDPDRAELEEVRDRVVRARGVQVTDRVRQMSLNP